MGARGTLAGRPSLAAVLFAAACFVLSAICLVASRQASAATKTEAERERSATRGRTRPDRPGLQGRMLRMVRIRRALWVTLAALMLALGLDRLFHLSGLLMAAGLHLVHKVGIHRPGHLLRLAILAGMAFALLLGAALGVLATRSAPALRWALAAGCALAAFVAIRAISFRASLMLGIPVGPFAAGDVGEALGLLATAVPAALAAGALRRGSRLRLAVPLFAVLLPGMLLAGAWAAARTGRPATRSAIGVGRGTTDAAGGGFGDAGPLGAYFANADLAGAPAFQRRDVRIDFDWGASERPGGSTSPGFDRVPHDGFSVRWTGVLVPDRGAPYTFEVDADGGARLWIKEPRAGAWVALVDSWTAGGKHASAPIALTAGVPVEVKMEYRHVSGSAHVRLSWSGWSGSSGGGLPAEVIDPVSTSGLNVVSVGWPGNYLWADAMKGGRYQWTAPDSDKLVPVDADGWPQRDADNIVWEGAAQTRGTYSLTFEGQAEVSVFPAASFAVGSKTFDVLPRGSGYDPRDNITRATINLAKDLPLIILRFRQTQRSRSGPVGTGVSQVRLMRPLTPGSAQSHPAGTLFAAGLKEAFSGFTTLRWILNFDKEAKWSERNRPSRAKAMRETEPPIWEHLVMLANETGRDLYICTPVNATDDYLLRLARLLRFGSDARGEPYRAATRDAVHPPLASNLRLYVERSNEIWNWSFSQSGDNLRQVREAAARRTPEALIAAYDRAAPGDGGDLWIRWHALQTKRISDIFRRVFGDGQMGRRVRVLYEYQYDDFQDTASGGLLFLDRYFNNGDGHHVPDPHPVHHYIWGAGAATYYSSGNPTGAQSAITVPDGGFERPRQSSGWKFSGRAGLYGQPVLADGLRLRDPGSRSRAPGRVVGLRFTVGKRPIAVYQIGRLVGADDTRKHNVQIVRAGDRSVAVAVEVDPKGAPPGKYAYTKLPHPAVLSAETAYLLASEETTDGDAVHTAPAVEPDPALRVDGPLLVNEDVAGNPGAWRLGGDGGGAAAAGPANFRFAVEPAPDIGFPPSPADGQQAAFLMGPAASLTSTVDFGRGGVHAVHFRAAGPGDNTAPIDIFLDERRITPFPGGRDPRVNPEPFLGGRWAYDRRDLLPYTSVAVDVAGPHTIRIASRGDDRQWVYLDDVRIVSVDAIFAGGMPSRGEANGQVAIDDYARQVASQARFAQAFGLRVVAYESGWSVGGDFETTVVQSAAKYLDPRAKTVNDRAVELAGRAGYNLTIWGTYDLWPVEFEAPSLAAKYPLVQSVLEANRRPAPRPASGQAVPATLAVGKASWASRNADRPAQLEAAGDLVSYNIIVAETGRFDVAVGSVGAGSLRLVVDGGQAAWTAGPAGRELSAAGILLPRGLHTVVVQSEQGSALIRTLSVKPSEPGAVR